MSTNTINNTTTPVVPLATYLRSSGLAASFFSFQPQLCPMISSFYSQKQKDLHPILGIQNDLLPQGFAGLFQALNDDPVLNKLGPSYK